MARSFLASAPFCSPCSQAAEPNSKPRVAGRGFGEGHGPRSARDRTHLRRSSPSESRAWNPRGPHRPPRTLAEPLRGAGDRLHPARVPGSLPHSERGPPPPTPARLRRLLQHHAATPIARQQQSPAPSYRTSTMRPDHRHSSGRRTPPPIPARRLITAHRDSPFARSSDPAGRRQHCGASRSRLNRLPLRPSHLRGTLLFRPWTVKLSVVPA